MTLSPTIGSLADSALAEVYGFSQTVDFATFLDADVDDEALEFPIALADGFSRGLVQIDDELMFVDEVDRAAKVLRVGRLERRGVRSTQRVEHSSGALVTMAPSIPRVAALAAVAEAIVSSEGLFSIASQRFVVSPSQAAYDLYPEADTLLDVSWFDTIGKQWVPLRHYRHDKHANQLVMGTFASVMPGADLRVRYARTPMVPISQDALFTDTGLPPSCADVIRLGAAYKLTASLEPATLLSQSAEADAMQRGNYPTSRLKVSGYFHQLYQARLAAEVAALQKRYPIRVTYGG